MHLFTLVFGIVLLPKAFTLKCHKCLPGGSGPCVATEKECPSAAYKCGAMRIISYAGNSKLGEVHLKTCLLPAQCNESSSNFGISRNVITSTCCTTNLCNTQPAPEPSNAIPNGRKCYRCTGKICTATLNCRGNEDHCISKTVNTGGVQTTLKGCASEQMCSNVQNAQIKVEMGGEISCCQGDFCNSASSTHAGLLLLVAPLLSLVVFS